MKIEALHEELPLLELFTRLREAGLPLGIDEYRLVLKALQEGFGTTDQEALAELCRTLWVKSQDEEHLFNYHFQQVITEPYPVKPSVIRQEEKTTLFPSPEVQEAVESQGNYSPDPPNTTPATVPVSSELMEVQDEMQVAEAV